MDDQQDTKLTVVVPWLQGGGAQASLRETMRGLQTSSAVLVVLFGNVRNSSSLEAEFHDVKHLNLSRTPAGVWRASRWLKNVLTPGDVVFSLMRGSHVVLGLLPQRLLRSLRLLGSFHQLPSVDARGWTSQIENVLVRRAMRNATLVTAPSKRALQELRTQKLIPMDAGVFSPNLIARSDRPRVAPRTGKLDEIRLLLAGRLDHQKGIDLIEPLLVDSPVAVRLLVAGDGPLQTVVNSLVNSDQLRVEYFGHVGDIFELIDTVDFLFLPSRFELNPVIVWEGWERGRSAITSNISAFEDLAQFGPLYMYSDRDELHALLARLASDSDELRRAAFNAPDPSDSANPLLLELRRMISND